MEDIPGLLPVSSGGGRGEEERRERMARRVEGARYDR